MLHAREDYNVIQDTTAARKLADLVLSMELVTDAGLVARRLAREVLGMPVKLGIPRGFRGGFVREIENPMYATGVGLVLHAIKSRSRGMASNVPEPKVRGDKRNILDRMKGWFDEL